MQNDDEPDRFTLYEAENMSVINAMEVMNQTRREKALREARVLCARAAQAEAAGDSWPESQLEELAAALQVIGMTTTQLREDAQTLQLWPLAQKAFAALPAPEEMAAKRGELEMQLADLEGKFALARRNPIGPDSVNAADVDRLTELRMAVSQFGQAELAVQERYHRAKARVQPLLELLAVATKVEERPTTSKPKTKATAA